MTEKYNVTSVEFGAFRAGEPTAYEIANKVMNNWDGKLTGVYKETPWIVNLVTNTITIMLDNRAPFKFSLEKISSGK